VNLTLDSSGKVATTLGGVTVSFNGFLAPLILVSQTQINCVVPYEVAGADNIVVIVTFAGLASNKLTLKGAAAAPGIFTLNGSGSGSGAILTTAGCPGGASQCVNSSSNPAPQGSTIVLYVTGEGQTMPAGVTGAVISVIRRASDAAAGSDAHGYSWWSSGQRCVLWGNAWSDIGSSSN
jgi:uncharacterized protein (TIGR03437 family)